MEGAHTRLDKVSGVLEAVADACIRPTRLVALADGTAVLANGTELLSLQLQEVTWVQSKGRMCVCNASEHLELTKGGLHFHWCVPFLGLGV